MNLRLLFHVCILSKFWRFLSFFSLTQGLEMHRTFLFLFGSLLGLFWGWSFFCGASTTILCSKMIKKAISFSLSLGLTLHNHVSQGIFRIIESYFHSIYIRTVSFEHLLLTLLIQFNLVYWSFDGLGRAKCTVHLISAPDQTSQEGNECITAYIKEDVKSLLS